MLAIRAARVFDGERMLPDGGQVVVAGGRIASVGPRTAPLPDAPVRELDGTLLPGLIDAHVHLCADAGPGALERLGEADGADLAPVIEESLRIHLSAGVTTVPDLGDRRDAVLAWRPSAPPGLPTVVASGTPPSPRPMRSACRSPLTRTPCPRYGRRSGPAWTASSTAPAWPRTAPGSPATWPGKSPRPEPRSARRSAPTRRSLCLPRSWPWPRPPGSPRTLFRP
jgi:hypothetical protein